MNKVDSIIKGQIVLKDKVMKGEVGIKEGKIISIHEGTGNLQSDEVKDYGDAFVFPGMIDVHVHCFSNPDEGFVTTSTSAAAGGITTFLDMPYDLPNPVNNVDQFKKKVKQLEEEAVVDICLWGTITKINGTDQIIPLAEAGAIAFKMSTFETDAYRFPRIPDPEIMKAMKLIEKTGLRAAFHSENDEIIVDLIDEYQKAGKVYPKAHNETRPPVTETSAVLKLMEFAYWTNVKLHIVHVSHPRTIDLIKLFQAQGVKVTCETCYPYLLMDVDDLDKYGPIAKNNPPLREQEEVQGLWKHIEEGNIDLVSSDHAPWSAEQKERGNENIFLASSGLPGVEIMIPLMFNSTVSNGRLTPNEFSNLMSTHPAEVFSIPGKGQISVGYDADFTVIDPAQKTVIDQNSFKSYSKLTPFNGQELNCKVISTILRGEEVFDGENVIKGPGFGKFVPGSAAK
ncbi:allantoinase [Sporosarcina sp. NCCP-2222]|uniref:dihydroorotase n=1 Tax=Sporosarcina sp. NCCP-2222 TaxID=2935073 RepID=UPI0020852A1E|nr:dihydroorotase [Sporosarcina sp. NCCP-2222]GKV54462.1 allantoinase [Sporosarcina sp. NCCP-2222]